MAIINLSITDKLHLEESFLVKDPVLVISDHLVISEYFVGPHVISIHDKLHAIDSFNLTIRSKEDNNA